MILYQPIDGAKHRTGQKNPKKQELKSDKNENAEKPFGYHGYRDALRLHICILRQFSFFLL